jgi:hypothetical protein
LLAVFLLAGCLLMAFNYQVDRWGVYRSDSLRFVDHIPPNIYYLKSRHLLESAGRKDCLVIGSSRVAAIDTSRIGGECYNFNHPYGSVTKHLALFSSLVSHGKAPDVIYLGLDDASYTLADHDAPGTRGAPQGLLDFLQFHAEYLLRFPQWVDMDIFSGRMPRVEKPWIALDPELELPQLREKAQAYFEDSKAHDKSFIDLRATIWGEEDLVEPTLELLREFKQLADAEGVRLVVFINPMHYMTYLKIDHEKFVRFRRGLAAITPFRDFGSLGELSVDNRYWAETSHYTPDLGDRIADCLTSPDTSNPEFCRRVDAGNIDSALQQQLATDTRFLFSNEKFRGATLLPPRLSDHILASVGVSPGGQAKELSAMAEYRDFDVVRPPYLHTDSVDPQIILRGSCFEPGQIFHMLLEVSYPRKQTAFVYSPTPAGRYSRTRRDRLDIGPGRHHIPLLVRGLDCDDYLRIDPLQNRGDIFLHSVLLRRLAPVDAF